MFKKKNQEAKKNKAPIPENRVLTNNSDFDTVETYKSIRTNIMFSMPKTEKGKIVVITSSSPGEGKTTTSINLAITFAQTGAKVILIDCDLRKSRIHRYLNLSRTDGVSNVLCGFTDLTKATKHNIRENLDCLTAGEIPPNPAELLETVEFEKMLAQLQEQYDYIFIDTPPMTLVTDATIAIKQSTGVIVVVQQNVTSFDLLDITMHDIKKMDVKILGVIMLGCEEKSKKYGYYRRSRYGHRYGYKYKYQYQYDYQYGDSGDTKK